MDVRVGPLRKLSTEELMLLNCGVGEDSTHEHHQMVDTEIRLIIFFTAKDGEALYSPWNSPGQDTGVGSLSLLQEIFPTQGLNPGLPALQVDSLPAELLGNIYKTA